MKSFIFLLILLISYNHNTTENLELIVLHKQSDCIKCDYIKTKIIDFTNTYKLPLKVISKSEREIVKSSIKNQYVKSTKVSFVFNDSLFSFFSKEITGKFNSSGYGIYKNNKLIFNSSFNHFNEDELKKIIRK